MPALESQVFQFIEASPSKVSFSRLRRHFCSSYRFEPKTLKKIVTGMVRAGDLYYSSFFGNSYLEISYDQPRVVSEHVVLKPPRRSWAAAEGQRVISLERGASFGVGEHPTTRLAIQILDSIIYNDLRSFNLPAFKAIDIGTGSGVLSIIAAALGIGNVSAIDTDPCAIAEAQLNVRLNHFENSIKLLDDHLETIPGGYDLVLANLRTPTLISLSKSIEQKTTAESILVFSGIKTAEITSVCNRYETYGFKLRKVSHEKEWSALALLRGDFQGAGLKRVS